MLIAEDLLLLLTNDATGKLAASASKVDVALGGALLVELALMQRVDVAGPSEDVRAGRLVLRDASATSDPLLDEALATVREKQGKRPQNVVTALGKHVRIRLYDRLVDRGLLRRESGKILPARCGLWFIPRRSVWGRWFTDQLRAFDRTDRRH